MKTKKTFILVISVCLLSGGLINKIQAQADTATPVPNKAKGGDEKMLLAGEIYTTWQSGKYPGSTTYTNSFANDPDFPLGLMLMPLIKLNDRLFIDVQVQVGANTSPQLLPGSLGSSGAAVALNEAIIYYHLTNGVNVFAGNFQPRSGIYEGILDDFTNRFATRPVGMNIGVSGESGLGIQGGIQCGYSKLLYQLYVANGPQLQVDSTGRTDGPVSYSNYSVNNNNKAVGGELGLLPFSNSSLELGVSGQYKQKTGDAGSLFENASNTVLTGYLNYYHTFSPIMIRLQGQYEYSQTQLSNNIYSNPSDTSILVPKYNDIISGWFAGATLRLSGSSSPFLSNLELGGRVGQLTPPKDAQWGGESTDQTTVCLTYWFTWKAPLSLAYDIYNTSGVQYKVFTVRGMWFF